MSYSLPGFVAMDTEYDTMPHPLFFRRLAKKIARVSHWHGACLMSRALPVSGEWEHSNTKVFGSNAHR